MNAANPLVAGPVDLSTPFTGAFLLEDGESLCHAIRNGDWVEGGLAAFSAIADTVATVMDPLGSLVAAGLGWVMEHLEPLKGWLNDLTGDAGEVAGFAATWGNISAQLSASGDELVRILADLDGDEGAAIEAYLRFQNDVAKHLYGASSWAGAMQVGMEIASTIVKIVHDLTRDALAQVVGSVVSYAAELVITVGLATPYVISQAASRVSSLAGRVSTAITRLLRSVKRLMGLLDELKAIFRRFSDLTDRTLRGGGSPHAPHAPRTPDAPGLPKNPHNPDAPHNSAPPRDPGPPSNPAPPHREPPDSPDNHALVPDNDSPGITPVPVDPDGVRIPGTDRTIDPDVYRDTLDMSTHNPDADDVMLGRWEGENNPNSYTNRAGDDHTYFSMGDQWDAVKQSQGLDDNQMFELYNEPFLDKGIDAEKPFIFSHDPKADPSSFLFRELEYLEDHGYFFDPDTMTATKA